MITASVHRQAVQQPGSRFDFGSIAETYDRWYDTRKGRAYDALEKRAIEKMLPRPPPGACLLEVGCGTGHWSAFFSAHGFSVTGVDVSPEMIAVAYAKHIVNAFFDVADAHALRFDEGKFDVTAAITTLEFVRDAEAVVREMARCTRRPGGALVVGALNALAPINRQRKKNAGLPYAQARLFTPSALYTLLARYGKTQIRVCAFVPAAPSLVGLAFLVEPVATALHLKDGAFIVGRVVL